MTTGQAMRMKLELASLAQRHRLTPPILRRLKLTDPVDGPLIVSGIAVPCEVDLERMRFKPFAFSNNCLCLSRYEKPRLLYKHREDEVAGTIEALSYDNRGRVRIRARVDHEAAKRCPAWSIAAIISEYEIINADRKDHHALIHRAEITEVSLTDSPCALTALVEARYKDPTAPYLDAVHHHDDLIQQSVNCMIRYVEALQTICAAPPATAARSTTGTIVPVLKQPTRPRPSGRERHRVGDFGALVAAIEARHPCAE